jgi:hypothetical protein
MKRFFKRIACWAASIAVAATVALSPAAGAAEYDPSGTFLNPFPENDIYKVTVFGDGFAQGLLGGLQQAFNGDVRLTIEPQVSQLSRITSRGFEAKLAALDKAVSEKPFDIAVVMIGAEDRISMRSADGKRIAAGSDEWLAEYARRIDLLMRAFKRKNAGVYWVGLPTIARGEDLVQQMNDVLRERAYLNGCKYIDTYQGFTDEDGGYSAYGPDLEGVIRLLRLRDGISFTAAGNRKLAHFVEKELRSDLRQAKSNRNVPLLGAEAEQARIHPQTSDKAAASASSGTAKPNSGQVPVVRGAAVDGTTPSAASTASGDLKVDNGKVVLKVAGRNGREELQTIQIVRPAIPASVVNLMARRDGSGPRGDLLVDQLDGGVTLMSSVTPSDSKDRGRLSPTQAPYFRVLVKGERLRPKPGRADDLSWPPKNDTTSQAKPSEPSPRG